MFGHGVERKDFLSGARICEPLGILKQAPGILKSKSSIMSRVNY